MPLAAVNCWPPTLMALTNVSAAPVDVIWMSSNTAWNVFWLPWPALVDHSPTANPLLWPCTVYWPLMADRIEVPARLIGAPVTVVVPLVPVYVIEGVACD